jgi:hypothetical protein
MKFTGSGIWDITWRYRMMTTLAIVALVSIILPTSCMAAAVDQAQSGTQQDAGAGAGSDGGAVGAHSGTPRVVFRLDFSEYPGGSVEEWLESKGFRFREAAKNRDQLGLTIDGGALIFAAKEQIRGFVYDESLHIEKFSKVRLEWGIIKFPEGASYERQVRNEALMVYVSFGHEKTSSGSIILPNVPYFIGLFLCNGDKLQTPYIGRYYHEGGRFVCLGHAMPHQTVISEFDLVTGFQTYFEKSEVPPISGINFGVDTSDAGDGGRASAFIKTLEFLE